MHCTGTVRSDTLNAYALAFGILGAGLFVAGLVPVLPVVRRHGQVLRFRKALAYVDVVVVSWEASLGDRAPSDEVPDRLPQLRRSWRGRRRERDGSGDPWA
jgi:hypothetical protein